MGCTALRPGMTPRDQALFLNERIAPGLFGGVGVDQARVAWRLSPEPFWLSPQTLAAIEHLGTDLLRFYQGLNALYNRSARGTAPAFIAAYLDQGKPEAVIKIARQNRFKSDIPRVLRPDLILTEGGFIAAELDNVPGGMGFVGSMAQAYCELGYDTTGGRDGMPEAFAAMIADASKKEQPVCAIVVSDEAGDYFTELEWLAQAATVLGRAHVFVCKPQQIVFSEEALFVRLEDGREEKIDVLYRNFEMFDLFNIPKQELMLYAARHNRVAFTPPPKAQLEEKLAFALLHHPSLAKLWREALGDAFDRLKTIFPATWILDPAPLPPQGFYAGIDAAGEPLHDWMQLVPLGKSERDYVVKPSGFSEWAWGSRGVKVANDLTREEWEAALRDGLAAFGHTPHVLQRFHKGKRVKTPFFDRTTDDVRDLDGRVRLCPYYFVIGDAVRLGGILATVAPADKRLIHGMADAIMAPCGVSESGY